MGTGRASIPLQYDYLEHGTSIVKPDQAASLWSFIEPVNSYKPTLVRTLTYLISCTVDV